jgi:spermidine/putrescine transport system permease protein
MKPASFSWLMPYAIAFVVFLYLPVLLLPLFSFNASATPTLPLSGFTFDWYESLAANKPMHSAAWNSLIVGAASAALSTVLGFCAARAMTRHAFAGRNMAAALIMAPLVLPEIIIAISLLIVILAIGLQLSLMTVIAGHVLVCTPYCVSVMASGFEGFDNSLEEASRDLGETAFGTLRRVTLPVLFPSILSSALVSFTVSLDEFILAFFLSGNDPTLPVYVWGQLRFAAKLPAVLALGSIMLILSLVLVAFAEFFRRRGEARLRRDYSLPEPANET